MVPKHDYLGKLFISHSSSDKRVALRIKNVLEKNGFDCWIDNHELLLGDQIRSKILDALNQTQILILICSSTSIKSDWIQFEIEVAISRMDERKCKIIPLIIEPIEIPEKISHLLCENFTNGWSAGCQNLLKTLENLAYEAFIEQSFHKRTQYNLEMFYGRSGGASVPDEVGFSETDYDSFTISNSEGDEMDIVYKIVPNYYPHGSLNSYWLDEYFEQVIVKIDETYFLIISEKPIVIAYSEMSDIDPHFGIKELQRKNEKIYVVFVDLSKIFDQMEQRRIIEKSRRVFLE